MFFPSRLHVGLLAATLSSALSAEVLQLGPWSGGVTHQSAEIIAKLPMKGTPPPDTDLRLEVSETPDFEKHLDFEPVPPVIENSSPYLRRFFVIGLKPNSLYHYRVSRAGKFDADRVGSFATLPKPGQPTSFKFVFGSCAKTGSASPVFTTMQKEAPLFFLHAGDLHYEDIKSTDIKKFRSAYQKVWESPTQAALYRNTPTVYVWDDHDFTGNGSDSGASNAKVAFDAYRENVPHHRFVAPFESGLIAQKFEVGRVLFLVLDCRSARSDENAHDDASKTMLGTWQKEWLKDELKKAKDRPLVFLVSSVSWVSKKSENGDNWGRYTTERAELSNFIKSNGINNLAALSGDAHMLAADDGSNNQYAQGGGPGFPCLQAAPLDQKGSLKGGPWSIAPIAPGPEGGSQFGLVRVTDEGAGPVNVTFQGMSAEGKEVMRLEFASPKAK